MSAERSLVLSRLPQLRMSSPLRLAPHVPALPPAICAPRATLSSASCGRLVYYTNASDGPHLHERPLILLHAIHESGSSYEMRLLFESFRGDRPVYALDLPGFGASEREERDYTPELYLAAIRALIEHVTRGGSAAADVVAVGLTSELAAQVTVKQPTRVHSLTLISPTGFAVKRELQRLERVARHGKSPLALRVFDALGLSPLLYRGLVSRRSLRRQVLRLVKPGVRVADEVLRYLYATTHQPGAHRAALAYRSGGLFPQGNPQSIYTRVHCPTLIVYPEQGTQAFGSLATFVKWREHFRAARVDDASLLHEESAEQVATNMKTFFHEVEQQELEELDHQWHRGDLGSRDVATLSSY